MRSSLQPRTTSLVAPLLAITLLAGCVGVKGVTVGEAALANPEIARWVECRQGEPGVYVRDFGQSRAVAICLGERPTGGWRISVNVRMDEDTYVIRYAVKGPGLGQPATHGLTYPHAVVLLDAKQQVRVFQGRREQPICIDTGRAKNGWFEICAPLVGASVGQVVRVTGMANIPAGAFLIKLTDAARVVSQCEVKLSPQPAGWRQFDVAFAAGAPASGCGSLSFFVPGPDGRQVLKLTIPVAFRKSD